MPRLKVLSGKDAIKIFNSFGFEIVGQRGSHVKLRRLTGSNKKTLRAICRQASVYISEDRLKKCFYG